MQHLRDGPPGGSQEPLDTDVQILRSCLGILTGQIKKQSKKKSKTKGKGKGGEQ